MIIYQILIYIWSYFIILNDTDLYESPAYNLISQNDTNNNNNERNVTDTNILATESTHTIVNDLNITTSTALKKLLTTDVTHIDYDLFQVNISKEYKSTDSYDTSLSTVKAPVFVNPFEVKQYCSFTCIPYAHISLYINVTLFARYFCKNGTLLSNGYIDTYNRDDNIHFLGLSNLPYETVFILNNATQSVISCSLEYTVLNFFHTFSIRSMYTTYRLIDKRCSFPVLPLNLYSLDGQIISESFTNLFTGNKIFFNTKINDVLLYTFRDYFEFITRNTSHTYILSYPNGTIFKLCSSRTLHDVHEIILPQFSVHEIIAPQFSTGTSISELVLTPKCNVTTYRNNSRDDDFYAALYIDFDCDDVSKSFNISSHISSSIINISYVNTSISASRIGTCNFTCTSTETYKLSDSNLQYGTPLFIYNCGSLHYETSNGLLPLRVNNSWYIYNNYNYNTKYVYNNYNYNTKYVSSYIIYRNNTPISSCYVNNLFELDGKITYGIYGKLNTKDITFTNSCSIDSNSIVDFTVVYENSSIVTSNRHNHLIKVSNPFLLYGLYPLKIFSNYTSHRLSLNTYNVIQNASYESMCYSDVNGQINIELIDTVDMSYYSKYMFNAQIQNYEIQNITTTFNKFTNLSNSHLELILTNIGTQRVCYVASNKLHSVKICLTLDIIDSLANILKIIFFVILAFGIFSLSFLMFANIDIIRALFTNIDNKSSAVEASLHDPILEDKCSDLSKSSLLVSLLKTTKNPTAKDCDFDDNADTITMAKRLTNFLHLYSKFNYSKLQNDDLSSSNVDIPQELNHSIDTCNINSTSEMKYCTSDVKFTPIINEGFIDDDTDNEGFKNDETIIHVPHANDNVKPGNVTVEALDHLPDVVLVNHSMDTYNINSYHSSVVSTCEMGDCTSDVSFTPIIKEVINDDTNNERFKNDETIIHVPHANDNDKVKPGNVTVETVDKLHLPDVVLVTQTSYPSEPTNASKTENMF